jgi:DNA (cytosine-5)-methyltransferase 1
LNALDLFAGPGGWDVGAQALGIDPLGIEYDDAAVATRKAYRLRTIHADVTTLDPVEVMPDGCDLLIASPPCQAWSMAGSRQGEHDRENVYKLARDWGKGANDDWAVWADERSPLAAEPMRWVDALEPGLVAFEQVPPVIDLWRLCASLLAERGYAVWTGILSAERYGVPQTRKRAILMASKIGGVHPPLPTHLPYVAGEPKPTEPMLTLEGELLPWVSMAEALGWGEGEGTGSATNLGEGMMRREAEAGGSGVRTPRKASAPGPVITEGVRCWRRVFDVPAPTQSRFLNTGRDWKKGGTREDAQTIEGEAPAPALDGQAGKMRWVDEKPASTLAGDPRVPGPGHKRDEKYPDAPGRMEEAVRVTIEEASVLQSFPPDYPWQGSRTKQFQQIGNAVPPLMAKAILEALIA